MNSVYSLAVIGCGLTGTSMLYQFIKKLEHLKKRHDLRLYPMNIIVFEKTVSTGPGLPYEKTNIFPCHISNMPAGDMSIVADCPEDLLNWFHENRTALVHRYPELVPFIPGAPEKDMNNLFLPRMVMGEYLHCRLDDAVTAARILNVEVVIRKKSDVIDITEKDDVLTIVARDEETHHISHIYSKRALLATGHWLSAPPQKRYFPSPWPAESLLKQIPTNSTVGVLGTSLSAIDTALTLFSDGKFSRDSSGTLKFTPADTARQVTLYSRKGLLPKVRGRVGSYQNRFFSLSGLSRLNRQAHGDLTLEILFELLNKELETAYGRKIAWEAVLSPQNDAFSILKQDILQAQQGDTPEGDILWQTIFFQAIPLMKQVYLKLTPAHRHWFETDFKSVFMAHAAVIPLVNAEKMLAYLESGVLTVKKLKEAYQMNPVPDSQGFEFSYRDDTGKMIRDTCDFVVDARGQSLSYRSNPSALAKNMLASGTVLIETVAIDESLTRTNQPAGIPRTAETGGLWIDPESFRVIQKDRHNGISISNRLFAVGIMNRGQIINASMARECAAATSRIADHIISEIMGP